MCLCFLCIFPLRHKMKIKINIFPSQKNATSAIIYFENELCKNATSAIIYFDENELWKNAQTSVSSYFLFSIFCIYKRVASFFYMYTIFDTVLIEINFENKYFSFAKMQHRPSFTLKMNYVKMQHRLSFTLKMNYVKMQHRLSFTLKMNYGKMHKHRSSYFLFSIFCIYKRVAKLRAWQNNYSCKPQPVTKNHHHPPSI
jgi:hypothetical protein